MDKLPVAPEHARLSPSSSGRWLMCPGSVKMCENVPNEDSVASLRGRAIHAFAAHALSLKSVGWAVHVGKRYEGVELTAEDVEIARRYVQVIRDADPAPGNLHVEVPLDLSFVEPGTFGTADAVILSKDGQHLAVIDLKTGRSKVHPEANTQLMLYALGALDKIDLLDEVTHVTMSIVQPPLYDADMVPISSVTMSVQELNSHRGAFRAAARATHDENAPLVPGAWCRWCPARNSCPKQQSLSQGDVQEILLKMDQPLVLSELTNEALSNVLRVVKACEAWSDDVKREVRARMDAGQTVPGCSYGSPRRQRAWAEPHGDAWIRHLPPLLGADLLRPVTVAQAEKYLKGSTIQIPHECIVETLTAAPLIFDKNAPAADPRESFGVLAVDDYTDVM